MSAVNERLVVVAFLAFVALTLVCFVASVAFWIESGDDGGPPPVGGWRAPEGAAAPALERAPEAEAKPAATPPAAESFTVVLVAVGAQPKRVLGALGAVGDLSREEATQTMGHAPAVAANGLSSTAAHALERALEDAGATVAVKPTGAWLAQPEAEVASPLHPSQVEGTLRLHRSKLAACVETRGPEPPPAELRLTVSLRIQANGRPKGVRVTGPGELASGPLADCLAQAIKRLRFPDNPIPTRLEALELGPCLLLGAGCDEP